MACRCHLLAGYLSGSLEEAGALVWWVHSGSDWTLICGLVGLGQGEVQALFLRHEGYLGAIGAFLKGAEQDSE